MLAFAIFAVTFVLSLIAVVIYLYPGSRNPSTIPGLDPVTREDGNFGDIAKAGSLHEFLVGLHKQFGPIASFWFGSTYTVSISDVKLFQEHQQAFDRPEALFLMFENFIGPKSIQYANGTDGRARRKLYDQAFTHDTCKKYFLTFQGIADDLEKKWTTLVKEEHIPLSQYMMAYALKCALIALFGKVFSDDKDILQFRKLYDIVWGEMELRLISPATPERENTFKDALKKLQTLIMQAVEERKKNPVVNGEELFIDLIIDHVADEEQQKSDCISYLVGGFHTTGNGLTWGFYFLATHPEFQEKVYKEITEVLKGEDVDHTNIGELVYLRQVLDETFRCSILAPWAARYQDFDSVIGGHKVPKNVVSWTNVHFVKFCDGHNVYFTKYNDGKHITPVIHALGVSLVNEEVWPMPDKFDPERFSQKNSKGRSNLAYSPFGFAGKRVCPGQRFAYIEATVAMVTLLRKFKVKMVEGQVIERVHGLVTHPSDEIWITLQKR